MICTFFGHRDTPQAVKPLLKEVCIDLIENQNVDHFYVGNQGSFDYIVRKLLADLERKYNITYEVVLAYMPDKSDPLYNEFRTLYPEGMEYVHPRFAIDRRNRWLVEHSDIVVTYVHRIIGGAAKFKELVEKKGKIIIELS